MKTMREFRVAAALLLSAAMGSTMVGRAQKPMAEGWQDAGTQDRHPSDVATLVQPDNDSAEGQEARQKVKLEIAARMVEVVKGKPYSADTTTETVQTLADGNHIVHRTVSKFYRDSDGRTRREQTFGDVDLEHPSPHEVKVFIDDPVSGLALVLDPASKSADKVHRSREFLDERNAEDDGARVMIKSDSEEGEQGAAGRMLIKFRDEHLAQIQDDKRDVVKEDLGTRNIEGVDCNGTRTTTTIPAGAIGNEKPISIVRETWYAPAIAAVVESTTEDPRYGKTTYHLTNVQLSEPSRSLFEPPADFKISVQK
jgi:hypothetical protein